MTNVTRLTVLTSGQPGAAPPAPPAQMGPMSFIGNPSSTFGPAIELSMPQATSMLSLFTSATQGVVPASGGGTQNFLRADGSWAPAGFGDIQGPAIVGNISATLGPPQPLTPAQLTTMVQLFTATTSGTVPASGGGALNFLRADGIWALPPSEEPMPGNTVWGNPSGVTGPGQPMTSSQLTPLINLFTATTSGTVPASGGGTAYVLRADGTWGLTAAEEPIPPYTLWGNFSPITAAPAPVTTTELTSMISLFTATAAGTVPPSGGGDMNFLRADGVWTQPPGIAPIPPHTVLGNWSSINSAPQPLSRAQLTSLVNLFTATTSGTVPASGGGTEKFLRADGTWADVPEFPLPLGHEGWPFVGNGPLPPSYQRLDSEGIEPGGVALWNIAHIAAGTVLGNFGPNARSPEALTGEQVTLMLDRFTTTHQGVVPPSTSLTHFLRGDGTWATPSFSDVHIPPDTVLGNVLPIAATAVPLNRIQLTNLVGVFPTFAPGLVPNPVTIPLGSRHLNYLQADGHWGEISLASLPAIPSNTVLGNVTGAAARPVALNQAQLTNMINLFSATLKGAVPASGGGTDNYLRADGTWVAAVPLAGGTMTGLLTLSGDPTQDLEAATKQYVDDLVEATDDRLDNYLPLAGGTMTGPINTSGLPTADAHAASKAYVDQAIAAQALFQGPWDADNNDPDLDDPVHHVNGYSWLVQTPDPTQPFTITATIPGLTGLTVYNGDTVIWSDAQNEFFHVPGSSLSLQEAQGMFLPFTGGALAGPGNLTIAGTLGVTGATTVSTVSATGNITTTADMSTRDLAVTRNGTVAGTLGVTGLSTLASLTVTGVTNLATTSGAVTVGSSSNNANFVARGQTYLAQFAGSAEVGSNGYAAAFNAWGETKLARLSGDVTVGENVDSNLIVRGGLSACQYAGNAIIGSAGVGANTGTMTITAFHTTRPALIVEQRAGNNFNQGARINRSNSTTVPSMQWAGILFGGATGSIVSVDAAGDGVFTPDPGGGVVTGNRVNARATWWVASNPQGDFVIDQAGSAMRTSGLSNTTHVTATTNPVSTTGIYIRRSDNQVYVNGRPVGFSAWRNYLNQCTPADGFSFYSGNACHIISDGIEVSFNIIMNYDETVNFIPGSHKIMFTIPAAVRPPSTSTSFYPPCTIITMPHTVPNPSLSWAGYVGVGGNGQVSVVVPGAAVIAGKIGYVHFVCRYFRTNPPAA